MKSNLLLFASLPFLCGVFVVSYASFPQDSPWTQGWICIAVISALLVFYCSKRQVSWTLPASLFFFCGVLCAINQKLGCEVHLLTEQRKATLLFLQTAVNDTPFKNETTTSLLQALLCGDKSLLSSELRQDFSKSGAAHILALSGLHLAILSGMLKKSLFFLGHSPAAQKIRNAIVVITSGAYTLCCGAGASLVRAFLFICLHCANEVLPHRKTPIGNQLLLASMIQLCLHPDSIKTLSFQLSYLSCTGIIFLFPHLDKWLPTEKGAARKIWSSLALSLSCQLFTAPLVYLKFGTLPKFFLLTNLLALPICEALMNVSVIAVILNTLGAYPRALIFLSDTFSETMLGILHIIATIT